MLHIKRTSVTLEAEELMELEDIMMSEDAQAAFRFLNESIYKMLLRSQRPYDPLLTNYSPLVSVSRS